MHAQILHGCLKYAIQDWGCLDNATKIITKAPGVDILGSENENTRCSLDDETIAISESVFKIRIKFPRMISGTKNWIA